MIEAEGSSVVLTHLILIRLIGRLKKSKGFALHIIPCKNRRHEIQIMRINMQLYSVQTNKVSTQHCVCRVFGITYNCYADLLVL